MGDDITILSAYLAELGIAGQHITDANIRSKITAAIAVGNTSITISDMGSYYTGFTSLTNIDNLIKLTQLGLLDIHGQTIANTFTADNLSVLDNTFVNKLNIYLQNNGICVKRDDEPSTTLKNLVVDYVNLPPTLSSTDQVIRIMSTTGSVANTYCKDTVKNRTHDFHVTGLEACSAGKCGGSGGGDCITSVSISGTSLVIQTGGCDTTTTLNNPVSDPQISYTKCTNCGNSKTLLRNEVDEVVDDSSALYNRDSNNEVCNHCLVSIGDEKHCNRFLDKEDCNYLGDSYAWVGA